MWLMHCTQEKVMIFLLVAKSNLQEGFGPNLAQTL
jgi:hypothetical protein